MEKVAYKGWENCYRLANDKVQVIVTTDIGPRVICYGFLDKPNHLGEFFESTNESPEGGQWKSYGGHRLWAAPESFPFSYAPDNDPLEARMEGALSVRLVQDLDEAGMQKEMVVTLDPTGTGVEIRHKLTNCTDRPLELSVWALTVFRGGEAFVPLEPYKSHDDAFLPSQPLILWPFTELADPRIKLGNGWLRMKSESDKAAPLKLGLANRQRWASHYNGTDLFVKRFNLVEGAKYPDFGSNCEFYVAGEYMELETLGPLAMLRPGDSMENTEWWELHTIQENGFDGLMESLRSKG